MPRTSRVLPVLLVWSCVLAGVVSGARSARAQEVHGDTGTAAESKSPTPDGAFSKPASMAEVLPKVQPFIVS